MAYIPAQAVNWASTPAPTSAAEIVPITSITPTTHVHLTQNILPAPNASSLAPDEAVGFATSG